MVYLLKVEGEFDDIIRLLYVMKMAAEGEDVSLGDVYNLSLWTIQRRLKDLGVTDLLFKGWEDNHLRNAIAHAHLTYEDRTQKMTFVDIDSRTGQETYKKSLDLKDFSEYALAIDVVESVFIYLMNLLRIRDIIIESVKTT